MKILTQSGEGLQKLYNRHFIFRKKNIEEKVRGIIDDVRLNGDEALKLAASVAPYADILEAGTPLIKSVGINIVRKLKSAHPEKIVLADLKS